MVTEPTSPTSSEDSEFTEIESVESPSVLSGKEISQASSSEAPAFDGAGEVAAGEAKLEAFDSIQPENLAAQETGLREVFEATVENIDQQMERLASREMVPASELTDVLLDLRNQLVSQAAGESQ